MLKLLSVLFIHISLVQAKSIINIAVGLRLVRTVALFKFNLVRYGIAGHCIT